MFGDISNFKEEDFFNSHPYGSLYYDQREHGIELFAFLEVDAYSSTLYSPGLTDAKMQQEYLDTIREEAIHYRDLAVTREDHLVLMSTCTTDQSNGRHVLVGRITTQIPEDAFAQEDDNKPHKTVDQDQGDGTIFLAGIILLLLLILVLLLILIIWKRRTEEETTATKNMQRRRKR